MIHPPWWSSKSTRWLYNYWSLKPRTKYLYLDQVSPWKVLKVLQLATHLIWMKTGKAGANSGCLSDSFLSAMQTLHKNELSHDKNREILKAGSCSWMFWFVTARDAWERLLTRLASTESETLKQREESCFNCSWVHIVKCECTSAGRISVYFQCWKISEINVAIIISRPVWLYLYF